MQLIQTEHSLSGPYWPRQQLYCMCPWTYYFWWLHTNIRDGVMVSNIISECLRIQSIMQCHIKGEGKLRWDILPAGTHLYCLLQCRSKSSPPADN